MLRILIAIGLMSLTFHAAQAAPRPLPEAKYYAVYAYADWCPNCKILTPRLAAVRAALAQEKLLFVTLDLTDKPRIQQSILLAQALGIGPFLQAQGSATGYVALLDAKTKKEVARFDRADEESAILERLRAALANQPNSLP